MLVNPIRGKAGKQIVALAPAIGTIMYTVPAGKYCEIPFIPANLIFTANGVTSAATLANAVPMLLQAGTVVTAAGIGLVFVGTEYEA